MGSSGRSGQPSPSRRTGQGRPHPRRSRCGWRLHQRSDLRLWMSNRASFLEGRPLSARQHLRAGKSERSIDNDAMAGANLHQCDRPKLLPESASCPALAQIGKVTPALQPARGMDASRNRTGQHEQADANAQVTLERCATGPASRHAAPASQPETRPTAHIHTKTWIGRRGQRPPTCLPGCHRMRSSKPGPTGPCTWPARRAVILNWSERAQKNMTRLMAQSLLPQSDGAPAFEPKPYDHRFRHPGWEKPPFRNLQQGFLAVQDWWDHATDHMRGLRPTMPTGPGSWRGKCWIWSRRPIFPP